MPIGCEALMLMVPGVVGQVSGVSNPNALAPLALRRWCGSLTLASPETAPSFFALGDWFSALGALLALALLVQGPKRALGQFFDLAGHFALIREAWQRVFLANRLLLVAITAAVLSWSGSQAVNFGQAQTREAIQNRAKEEIQLLSASRSLGELALEQGAFSAIVPVRDYVSLGSNLPLLIVVSIVLFRVATDRLGGRSEEEASGRLPSLPVWANLAWACGSLFVIYRLILDGFGETDLPVGGCLMIESIVIPFVMLVCDGILLAFFLVELRDVGAGIEPPEGDRFNTRSISELLPGAMLACFATIPARYLATFAWLLASSYLPTSVGTTPVGAWLRWLLGRGLTDIQSVALLFGAIAGVVAWTRGSLLETMFGYFRLLRTEGGRVVATLLLAGLACGLSSAVIYPTVLSLPTSFWLLNAADAYAHLATVAIGLFTLSALVTLGERSLPLAEVAAASDSKE